MNRTLLLIILIIFSADCWAQSLADIAKNERARQRQVQSKAIYSNTGIVATPSATTSSTPAAAAQTPPLQPSGPTDSKGRGEKYWRAAFQNARDDVKAAETKIVLLDLKIKDLNTQLLQRSDLYNRESVLGPQITAAQTEQELARTQLELAKQKVTDMEEELRKSGGLPGWAR